MQHMIWISDFNGSALSFDGAQYVLLLILLYKYIMYFFGECHHKLFIAIKYFMIVK